MLFIPECQDFESDSLSSLEEAMARNIMIQYAHCIECSDLDFISVSGFPPMYPPGSVELYREKLFEGYRRNVDLYERIYEKNALYEWPGYRAVMDEMRARYEREVLRECTGPEETLSATAKPSVRNSSL